MNQEVLNVDARPGVNHPRFGELITYRKGSAAAGVLGVIFALAGLGADVCFSPLLHPGPQGITWGQYFWVFSICTSIFGLLAWACFRAACEKYEYFETGAVMSRYGKMVREMAYLSVAQMTFEVIRQYINGLYVGTSLKVKLRDEAGKKMVFSGSHKAKPKGLAWTVFGKKFEGEDEMDVVKAIVADAMATKWLERLGRGESVEWVDKIVFTPQGLVPSRGKKRGTAIPYAKLQRYVAKNGGFHLFEEGEEKSVFNVMMNAKNFWPGYATLVQLVSALEAAKAEANGGGTEREAA